MDRSEAEALDGQDPLRSFRDRFVVSDPDLLYMDGNSLGRLPKDTAALLQEAVHQGWGTGLVRSWDQWIDLPQRAGNAIARIVGARPGEVIVADSTTVCLYKVLTAATGLRRGKGVILIDQHEFPTDRYVAEAVARLRGWEVAELPSDPVEGFGVDMVAESLDHRVGVVMLSLVNYRSGALADMAAITGLVRDSGALMIWDLSHAVGAVPVDVQSAGADAAVGCTYKYLNAGPGAPAFIYLSDRARSELEQPISGWFGASDQFEMHPRYRPAEGMTAWLSGTPPVLSLLPVAVGADLAYEAGIERLREKSVSMTEMAASMLDDLPAFSLGSPRDAARRGSHIAIRHPDARVLCDRLIAAGVVPDFRTPDVIRYACAPLYTTYSEIWDAIHTLAGLS